MPMSLSLLRQLQTSAPVGAWARIFDHVWKVCSPPLSPDKAPSEVTRRDAEVAAVDLFLASAGWDLWAAFEASVPRTADVLADWWGTHDPGRAVLILDALSLREVPWLLSGATERGYAVHQARATGAELPCDTTPFAKALGYASRSSLQNNGASKSGRLPGATTDATDLPWEDCAAQVNASPDWVLWHHWPDERMHDLSGPGHGLAALAREASEKLRGDAFWALVHSLSKGRRLIITSDHGYAASGHFPDTTDPAQGAYLKERFKSGRWVARADLEHDALGPWVPPLDLPLATTHIDGYFAMGRRKWKSQGGYPTLTHGGLSLLEVAVPFIELSRPL